MSGLNRKFSEFDSGEAQKPQRNPDCEHDDCKGPDCKNCPDLLVVERKYRVEVVRTVHRTYEVIAHSEAHAEEKACDDEGDVIREDWDTPDVESVKMIEEITKPESLPRQSQGQPLLDFDGSDNAR
jgi:hypothetical protein